MWKTCFISQTLALSYMCGTISRFVLEHAWSFYISCPCNLSSRVSFCSYYDTKAVFLAMGITALVCVAVTVFCFQTKVREWNGCSVCSLSGDVCCQWKRTSLSRVAVRYTVEIFMALVISSKCNVFGALTDGGHVLGPLRILTSFWSCEWPFPRHRWTSPPAGAFCVLPPWCWWSSGLSLPSSSPSNM